MFPYKIIRRNNKNVYIKIEDGVVLVTAPFSISENEIEKIVFKHKNWIESKIEKCQTLKDGDKVYIFDKEYIFTNKKLMNSIYATTINEWKIVLLDKAQCIFESRFYHYANYFNISNCTLHLDFYKSKWGSLNVKKNVMCLNLNLVFTDLNCLDAVIVHEFMHYRFLNHSKDFYKAVESVYPNYKNVMKKLKQYKIPSL